MTLTDQQIDRMLTQLSIVAANSSAAGVLLVSIDQRLGRIERALRGDAAPPRPKPDAVVIPFAGRVT